MFNNIGTVDRLIRLILASALFYLGLLVYSGSALGLALTIMATVLTVTAVVGSCLLYGLFGINTRNLQQN
jgi:uncharacterized membrane protein YgdD (TMEM256/DUF423 family)